MKVWKSHQGIGESPKLMEPCTAELKLSGLGAEW